MEQCSVSIAGGLVHGEYEQVKAVQSLILENERLRRECAEHAATTTRLSSTQGTPKIIQIMPPCSSDWDYRYYLIGLASNGSVYGFNSAFDWELIANNIEV